MIDAKVVKELREITGAGMMDCKKALMEVNGDMEKAIEYLKEKGIAKAAKKSTRIAAEGLVDVYVSEDNKVAAAIEVNAETDFVAKNAEFKEFVAKLAKLVAETNPKDLEDFYTKEYENGVTVQEELTSKIATIGENMNIRRFARLESDNVVSGYLHGAGKIAVLVKLEGGDKEVADDMCMQIAALSPEFIDESGVPAERLEKELETLRKQTIEEGKPADKVEMIAKGKLDKIVLGDICLVKQIFVKDSSKKVEVYLKEKSAKVVEFVRFEKGEGLEKRQENFAEEVMSQLK